MRPGPRTQEQLKRLARTWKQGEHVIISGATGSGKTALARKIDQIRIDRGGAVMVFVCKLSPDKTILEDYKGFTRWDRWKDRPPRDQSKVLLWPDISKAKTIDDKKAIQREVFSEAMDKLSNVGKWTVHFDEGLYLCDPEYMNLKSKIGMLHALGRSSKLTLITLTQRPSHLPLILYGSASHAFMGRTREAVDVKRLAEMGGKQSARATAAMITGASRHDFLWIPVAPDWDPELVNMRR